MWLNLFTIKNYIESVFLIKIDACFCVYKNKAPKTSSTTFNEAIYYRIFKCKIVQFTFQRDVFLQLFCIIFKSKLPKIWYDVIKTLEPFFAKLLQLYS